MKLENCFIKKIIYLDINKEIKGNLTLNLFPFNNENDIIIPFPFNIWSKEIDIIRNKIPLQPGNNNHFLTIDSQWFSKNSTLRREGIHIDGNFVADKNYPCKTWSNVEIIDNEIRKDWESEYDILVPFGNYIDSEKGGILSISSEEGCEAWEGSFNVDIFDGGEIKNELIFHKKGKILEKNYLYFMNSNTPHRTLEIEKGKRRTLIRITLNHNYENKIILEDIYKKIAI